MPRLGLGCLLIQVGFTAQHSGGRRTQEMQEMEHWDGNAWLAGESPSTLSQPGSREAARQKESCQHIVRGAFDHF